MKQEPVVGPSCPKAWGTGLWSAKVRGRKRLALGRRRSAITKGRDSGMVRNAAHNWSAGAVGTAGGGGACGTAHNSAMASQVQQGKAFTHRSHSTCGTGPPPSCVAKCMPSAWTPPLVVTRSVGRALRERQAHFVSREQCGCLRGVRSLGNNGHKSHHCGRSPGRNGG